MAEGRGLTVLGISKTEHGLCDPRLSTAMRMAKAVRVSLDTFYAAWAKTYDAATERMKNERTNEPENKAAKDDRSMEGPVDEPKSIDPTPL
jgi:transcriptional regulator with XRE-family HTH domain